MAQRFVLPFQTVFDALGTVADGAQVYFYASGTSSPLDTFSDQALSIPNTNPVVADSAGLLPDIWLQPLDYKVVAKTADDVELWTADPVSALGADGSDLTVTPTGAATSRTLADMAADELDVKAFGAAGDGKTGADGATTDASVTFTSALGTFAAADIGKPIVIEGAGDFIFPDNIVNAADNGSGLIRITTNAGHDNAHGETVTIKGVVGTTEANGSWKIDRIDIFNFDLRGSTFTNAYTSGGTVHGALSTTISGITSSTEITLLNPASATGTGLPYAYGTDDSAKIAAADTTISGQGLWFRQANYFVNAGTTIASDVTFDPGAILVVPRGKTVTFTGTVSAGFHQIFDLSAGGLIDITAATVEPLCLDLWGSDYSAGSQDAINSVGRDAEIRISRAEYLVSRSPSTFGKRVVWDVDPGTVLKGSSDSEITNGDFTDDISGWTDQSTGTASIAHDTINGRINLVGAAASIALAEQAVATVNIDREHVLEFEVVGTDGDTAEVVISAASLGSGFQSVTRVPGLHRTRFTPPSSPFYVQLKNAANSTVAIDNVRVIEESPLAVSGAQLGKIEIGNGVYTPTSNYDTGEENTHLRVAVGSPWNPKANNSAVAILQKHSTGNKNSFQDTTVYISQIHYNVGGTISEHRPVPIFCDMLDRGGGQNSFVEAGRLQSELAPDRLEPDAAIQDDGGVFTDETAEAASEAVNDMNLLPAVPVSGDRYMFGAVDKWSVLEITIGTAGAGTYTLTPKYWNGSTWFAFTAGNTVDGTDNFKNAGKNQFKFTMPGDWATTTVNSQGPFYYILFEVDGGTVTTVPLGDKARTTHTGGSNGLVSVAKADVYPQYLIGHESNVINASGIDAPEEWSAFENMIAYLASGSVAAGSGKIRAWYSTWGQAGGVTTAHIGYEVAPNRTDGTAFKSWAATSVGLDLSKGSQSDAAILLPNNTAIKSRNVGDNASHSILLYNAANQLVIGADAVDIKWGRGLIALGGGATPTFGTIGGSGPATAAQNTWLRFIDSGGTAAWIPVWK